MSKIYVVIDNSPEKYIRGVFSSEEKAEAYINQDTDLNDGDCCCYFEEYTLDEGLKVIPKEIKGRAYVCFKDRWDMAGGSWKQLAAGQVVDDLSKEGGSRLARPADTYDHIGFHYKNEGAYIFSFLNQEHAREVAQEKYENYLKELASGG